MLVTRIYTSLKGDLINLAGISNSLLSHERMFELDNEENQTGKNTMDENAYDIELEDFVFAYEEKRVLNGVSFYSQTRGRTVIVIAIS